MAYWSRFITVNRYVDAPKPIYHDLFEFVKDKDYFIITTNVDRCFQKAGFSKERLFYTQGDYGLFQCSKPCHQATYDNEEAIRRTVDEQKDMRIPPELIPKCPKCDSPMAMNLRSDDKFVEDEGWHIACGRYQDFVETRGNKRILFLELGVGYNTPVIITYPFWQMTAKNKNATYACINFDEAVAPVEIEKQAILLDADIGEVLKNLK